MTVQLSEAPDALYQDAAYEGAATTAPRESRQPTTAQDRPVWRVVLLLPRFSPGRLVVTFGRLADFWRGLNHPVRWGLSAAAVAVVLLMASLFDPFAGGDPATPRSDQAAGVDPPAAWHSSAPSAVRPAMNRESESTEAAEVRLNSPTVTRMKHHDGEHAAAAVHAGKLNHVARPNLRVSSRVTAQGVTSPADTPSGSGHLTAEANRSETLSPPAPRADTPVAEIARRPERYRGSSRFGNQAPRTRFRAAPGVAEMEGTITPLR